MEQPLMGDGTGGSGASAEPFNVIFCDDIRREASGKDILIGVYSAEMVFATVPTMVGVSIWIQLRTAGNGVVGAWVRVTDPTGNTAGQTRVDVLVGSAAGNPGGTTGALSMPPLPISVMHAGAINVYWSAGGNDFALIGEKRVTIGPAASGTAPPFAPRPPAAPA